MPGTNTFLKRPRGIVAAASLARSVPTRRSSSNRPRVSMVQNHVRSGTNHPDGTGRDVTPSLSSSRSIISSPNSTTKNFHGITGRPTVSEDLQGAAERRDDQDKPSSQLCSRCGRIIYGIGWPRDATERNADGAHREANTRVTAATPVK